VSKISKVEEVPLNCIRPSRFQVRETFKQEDLEALARSFKEGTLSQPILLRPVAADPEDAKDASGQPLPAYEVISGELRLRAAKLLGWTTIRSIVEEMTDREAAMRGFEENEQRHELNIVERAKGYKMLMGDPCNLSQDAIAARMGLKNNSMVSRMLRYKGVEVLAEAAWLLRKRGVDARILLIGPLDPDSPASLLASEIRRLMKPGVIEWLGPTEDVLAVWQTSHIAVFPTQYREGVPLALLEAAACARPIVSTDTPGCREVVKDGVNGILVPQGDPRALADALQRLIVDKELRVRMGREGRLRVERLFTKEIIVRQTLDMYGAALGRKL